MSGSFGSARRGAGQQRELSKAREEDLGGGPRQGQAPWAALGVRVSSQRKEQTRLGFGVCLRAEEERAVGS